MEKNEKREFYKGLNERIKQLRMEHLFEEPCPLYEPEWEEDYFWDCRLTYDHEEEEWVMFNFLLDLLCKPLGALVSWDFF